MKVPTVVKTATIETVPVEHLIAREVDKLIYKTTLAILRAEQADARQRAADTARLMVNDALASVLDRSQSKAVYDSR